MRSSLWQVRQRSELGTKITKPRGKALQMVHGCCCKSRWSPEKLAQYTERPVFYNVWHISSMSQKLVSMDINGEWVSQVSQLVVSTRFFFVFSLCFPPHLGMSPTDIFGHWDPDIERRWCFWSSWSFSTRPCRSGGLMDMEFRWILIELPKLIRVILVGGFKHFLFSIIYGIILPID